MAADPVKLTQELVRCPSVTPEDAGAQQVLIDALKPYGFVCETLQFEDITNLFARLGDEGPHLCFCGHTDVVPTGDKNSWRHDPFSGAIEDNIVYGRGTADMKGNIACFVAALAQFIQDYGAPKGSISLLITGDEEGPAVNGTVKVLEWMDENGHTPDHALVGEPSNPAAMGDEIRIGRRGSLTGHLTVTGTQGHVAYPHLADNPLPRLVKLLDALAGHEFDSGSDHFQPTNLELTSIDTGNTVDNIIPAKVTAHFNVRFNDHWTAATLETKIREILESISPDFILDCSSNAESFITEPGALTDTISNAVNEVTGRTPKLSTGGGTSDARFVTNYCPVVECGLVNKTIHQIDEHVSITDLETLTAIYKNFLERYFGM